MTAPAREVYLVEVRPVARGTITPDLPLYFSTGALTPLFDAHADPELEDIGPQQLWRARLSTVYNAQADLEDGENLFGRVRAVAGVVKVLLGNGDADAFCGYSFCGRAIRIWRGLDGQPFASFTTIFRGVLDDVTWTDREASFIIRDPAALLEQPIQTVTYQGTGGTEGGDDLKGKPKPLLLGQCTNIEPVLVDGVNRIYQLHDGPFIETTDAFAVFDRGVPLSWAGDIAGLGLPNLPAWTPVGGRYVTDRAHGTFTVGAPPAGLITCDAYGKGDQGQQLNFIGQLVTFLFSRGMLRDVGLDTPAWTALPSFATGLYLPGGNDTVADVLTQFGVTFGAAWWVNGARQLTVRQLAFGTPVATLNAGLIASLERTRTAPPIYKWTPEIRRIWRVQTPDELAAASTRKELVTKPGTTVDGFLAPNMLAEQPLSRTLETRTLMSNYNAAAASTEHDRQWDLRRVPRDRYTLKVRNRAFAYRVGDTVTVEYPRFELDAGRDFIVTGVTENLDRPVATELRVWG